jgi:hypothetical protein
MTRPAADTEVSNRNSYYRQRRYDESPPISVDGNICLTSETNPEVSIEEAHQDNVFRSFVDEDSIQRSNVKVLNQQKSGLEDWKFDIQAFENNSLVGVPRLAAETKVSNKNTYDRQNRDTECTIDSVCLNICLRSEIDPIDPIGASPKAFIASSESWLICSPSIHYWNRRLNQKFYQRHSNSFRATEPTFSAGSSFGFYVLKEFDSGWNAPSFMFFVYSSNYGNDCLRLLEHHFSVGWLTYSKSGVIDVCRSFNSNINLKSFESNPRMVKSNSTGSS